MADDFLKLPPSIRKEVLDTAAGRASAKHAAQLSAAVLEKDVWVCWALQALFSLPDNKDLAFKGGTTLSKVFNLIQRFSEDIDVTIDYRSLRLSRDPLDGTLTASQKKKITDDLREQTNEYVSGTLKPHLEIKLQNAIAPDEQGSVQLGKEEGSLEVRYPSALNEGRTYIPERVLIEFGGRNTTQPKAPHDLHPYLKAFTQDLDFPIATVQVLSPKRTFWEKVTLIHAELGRPTLKSGLERMARHWYDLSLLTDSPIGKEAIQDRELLESVVRHKKVFFRAGYADYDACLSGGLRLVPEGRAGEVLEADYKAMIEAGMFFATPPTFDEILATLQAS